MGVSVGTSTAYDAFGGYHQYRAQGQPDPNNPVAFGGQYGYYKDYSGRYLLTHRYYDPFAGRFVTRDPIGYQGVLNLYGFAGNNPDFIGGGRTAGGDREFMIDNCLIPKGANI